MRNSFFFLILSLFFLINISAQKPLQKDANLEQTQKWLKKNLIREGGIIREVKFEGCKVFISLGYSSFSAWSGSGGFVGGGFPNDESSAFFSAGPDRALASGSWKRKMIFDITDLDAENINIQAHRLKNRSGVTFRTVGEQKKISVTENKKTTNQSMFWITVKTKSAEKFADAFRQAIQKCKE